MRRMLLPALGLALALGLTACGTDDPVVVSPPDDQDPTDDPVGTDPDDDDGEDPDDGTAVDGDCSAAALAGATADFSPLPAEAAATAEFLLDAALRCDEQLLATAASEDSTSLSFGNADPYEWFGLPDSDGKYAALVRVLTEVRYSAEPDDSIPATFVWPRVATTEWDQSDEAWQEVVDAGLLTAEEAAQQRAAGSGYLGWRVGIRGDGAWLYFVAGD